MTTYRAATDLLRSIKKRNPSADKEALFILFFEELAKPGARALLGQVVRDYYSRFYASLFSARMAESRQERKNMAAEFERIKREYVKREARIMLLDLVQPTGKRLRNSTKEEIEAAGGWLAEIADRLKPGQKVGDHMKEDEVRQIFDSWAGSK